MEQNFIKSPLNYTGGKYKLLSQLTPLFPKEINTFCEPFAGGFNVSLNINANQYILNDSCKELMDLWDYFYNVNIEDFLKEIQRHIALYDLSITNVDAYNKLRNDRNTLKDNHLLFFLLICYGFNHQIRFNGNGDFNIPFGKDRSSYNKNIEMNLIKTLQRLQSYKEVQFLNQDFRTLDYSKLTTNDFVYVDPPYLITMATYNALWGEQEEKDLLNLLTKLDKQGVKFGLSNVLEHNGKENKLLKEWAQDYNVIDLTMTYENSNYHKKNKQNTSKEVYICNY